MPKTPSHLTQATDPAASVKPVRRFRIARMPLSNRPVVIPARGSA